jgi:NTE family protein
MARLGYSSKLNTERDFLRRLRDLGRARADSFLRAHRVELGRRGTLDLRSFV